MDIDHLVYYVWRLNDFYTYLNIGLSNRRIHDSALFAVHHLRLLGVKELRRVWRYRSEQLNVPCPMRVLQRCRGQMINVCNVKDGKQIPILNSLEIHVRCWMHILIIRLSHYVLTRLPVCSISLKNWYKCHLPLVPPLCNGCHARADGVLVLL